MEAFRRGQGVTGVTQFFCSVTEPVTWQLTVLPVPRTDPTCWRVIWPWTDPDPPLALPLSTVQLITPYCGSQLVTPLPVTDQVVSDGGHDAIG
jgi:hypothetical protein